MSDDTLQFSESWWLSPDGHLDPERHRTAQDRMRREIPRPAVQDYLDLMLREEERLLRVAVVEPPEQDPLELGDAPDEDEAP